MSKVILVANQCDFVPIEKDVSYIGVDGGSFFCLSNNIPMLCAIGDFDSIDEPQFKQLQTYTKLIQLPCEKNETDGEYALRYAYDQGFDEIDMYGVIGGRQDHFIAMITLLRHSQIDFRIIDEQNTIYTLQAGNHKIKKKYKYLSFFACEDLNITLSKVRYPLENRHITEKDVYLVSNEIIEDECELYITGKILVIESNDKQ